MAFGGRKEDALLNGFDALDDVNYAKLGEGTSDLMCQIKAISQEHDLLQSLEHPNLEIMATKVLVSSPGMIDYFGKKRCLLWLPSHLFPLMLQQAIIMKNGSAVSSLVAWWPMKTLRLRDSWTTRVMPTLNDDSHWVIRAILDGLTCPASSSIRKLTCLDLTNFIVKSSTILFLLLLHVPLLTALKKDRDNNLITPHILAAVPVMDELAFKWAPIILGNQSDCVRNKSIRLPRGENFVVMMNDVHFNPGRLVTLVAGSVMQHQKERKRCKFRMDRISVPSRETPGETSDHQALELAFLAQENKDLTRLALRLNELEPCLPVLCKFDKLVALDVGQRCIDLSARTRSKSKARSHLMKLLEALPHLKRLDISDYFIFGRLADLLESVASPLEFLSVSGCVLGPEDLCYLSNCKHTSSLKELHMCNVAILEHDETTPIHLLMCVDAMASGLSILKINNNDLCKSVEGDDLLARVISRMPNVYLLDITNNKMNEASVIKLIQASRHCPLLDFLSLSLNISFEERDQADKMLLSVNQACDHLLKEQGKHFCSLVITAKIEHGPYNFEDDEWF